MMAREHGTGTRWPRHGKRSYSERKEERQDNSGKLGGGGRSEQGKIKKKEFTKKESESVAKGESGRVLTPKRRRASPSKKEHGRVRYNYIITITMDAIIMPRRGREGKRAMTGTIGMGLG